MHNTKAKKPLILIQQEYNPQEWKNQNHFDSKFASDFDLTRTKFTTSHFELLILIQQECNA
jgi:hypothetical protein